MENLNAVVQNDYVETENYIAYKKINFKIINMNMRLLHAKLRTEKIINRCKRINEQERLEYQQVDAEEVENTITFKEINEQLMLRDLIINLRRNLSFKYIYISVDRAIESYERIWLIP